MRTSEALRGAIGLGAMAAIAFSGEALATNTSGVFGPAVKAGDRSAEYRVGFAPGQDGARDRIAHRLHYQHAFNDSHRLRGVIGAGNQETGDWELQNVTAEWQWQFLERTPEGWQSALRLDLRWVEEDDGADSVGLNWTNQVDLESGVQLRGIAMAAVQTGGGRRDGVFLQTRASVSVPLADGPRMGVEMFSAYGSTDNLGSFNDQSHAIGPFVSARVTEDWSVFAGTLVGLTDNTRDADIRLWVGKSF